MKKQKIILYLTIIVIIIFVTLSSCAKNDSPVNVLIPESESIDGTSKIADGLQDTTALPEETVYVQNEMPAATEIETQHIEIPMPEFDCLNGVHNWDNWTMTVPSTCLIQGQMERLCRICGSVEKESAPLHNLVVNEAREVTCTRKGWNEYVSCRDCDYTTYSEIAPLDHKYESNFCKNCGRTALSMGIVNGEAVAFGIGCYRGARLVIPAQHMGYPVTQIGLDSFPEVHGIQIVVFPNTINKLDANCFANCPDLKRIYVPEVFVEDYHLKLIKGPNLSEYYYLPPERLESPCYVKVESIKGVLTVVGIGDFQGENIVIPETYEGLPIKAIADGAFENCDRIRSVVMPYRIEKIGSKAFAGCTSLREVIFDNSNSHTKVTIAHDAFEGCSEIHLEIPWNISNDLACFDEAVTTATIHSGIDGWISIYPPQKRRADDTCGTYNYVSCVKYFKNLDTLIIGDDVVGIWDYAFTDCNNFSTLIISGNVMKMGLNTFENCKNLKKVILKKGISVIGDDAFKGCDSIAECIVEWPVNWTTGDDLTDAKIAARWLVSKSIKKRPFINKQKPVW